MTYEIMAIRTYIKVQLIHKINNKRKKINNYYLNQNCSTCMKKKNRMIIIFITILTKKLQGFNSKDNYNVR